MLPSRVTVARSSSRLPPVASGWRATKGVSLKQSIRRARRETLSGYSPSRAMLSRMVAAILAVTDYLVVEFYVLGCLFAGAKLDCVARMEIQLARDVVGD